jgi:hypothetical protein
MFILNPTELVSHKINKYAGERVLFSPETQIVNKSPIRRPLNPEDEGRRLDYIGIRFQVKF